MVLQAADARRLARRLNDDRLAAMQLSAGQRAGDDRADAAQRKHTVHGQARFADVARRRRITQNERERRFQFVDAATSDN